MATADVVLWRPQEGPQTEFASRPEFEVLYGGAKGGGKSDVLLMEGLRQIGNPRYRGVFFRRTYPRLQEMIDRAWQHFPKIGGQWRGQDHRWTFPSGARYDFRHLQDEESKYDYQGQEFHYMAFDQLEEFTETQYDYMLAQVRTSDPTIRTYVRASANPGNIGHGWVKKRFIDGRAPYKRYVEEFTLPDGRVLTLDRAFIPAKVYDNQILLQANPQYLARLMALPQDLRAAMLEGNWDTFAGQAFPEWDSSVHVVEPFAIPDDWLRFTATDWGRNDECATLWFAVSPDRELLAYRERVARGVGARETARAILDLSSGEHIAYHTIGDDVDAQSGHEETTGDLMRREGYHYRAMPRAPGSRVSSKQVIHDWLRVEERDGSPWTRFRAFRSCVRLIREVPSLVYDAHRVEDVVHSDVYDALRYGVMSRPRPARVEEAPLQGVWLAAELRAKGYSEARIRKLRETVKIIGR